MKPGKHQRSKTKMPRFMLEGPRQCTIFLFCTHTLCMNYVTNTFLLVSSSVRSKQLLCSVHRQGQKSEQKHTTKNFIEFHNHSPLLTTIARLKLTDHFQRTKLITLLTDKHYSTDSELFSITF